MDKCTKLKILQWNARSIKNKSDFPNYCDTYDIIALNETRLKPKDNFHINNFEIVRFDRISNQGGGIAILIRKNLIFDVLNWELESNSLEIGAIVVRTNLGDIVIVVCYRSPI